VLNFPLDFATAHAVTLWALRDFPWTSITIHNPLDSLRFHVPTTGPLPHFVPRPKISDSDLTAFSQGRVVVEVGSIETVARSTLNKTEILCVWIPDSAVILNCGRPAGRQGMGKNTGDSSRLYLNQIHTWHELSRKHFLIHHFNQSSFQSNVEILGSKCFSSCNSFSESHLKQIHDWHELNLKHFHLHHFNQSWFRAPWKFLNQTVFSIVTHFHQSDLNQIHVWLKSRTQSHSRGSVQFQRFDIYPYPCNRSDYSKASFLLLPFTHGIAIGWRK
jgi:hypothetical protein